MNDSLQAPTQYRSQTAELVRVADQHRLRGSYESAERIYQQLHEIACDTFGCESIEAAGTLNDLGVAFKFLGRYDEAADVYRAALKIIQTQAANDYDTLASLYHNLGGLEHACGRYKEGEPLARRSVELRKQVHGIDHPAVAADMAALAAILHYLPSEQQEEAKQLYAQSLGIYERHYGPDHYEVGFTLSSLAALRHATGDHDEAELLYQHALKTLRSAVGSQHPDVAAALNNLAVLYDERGDMESAQRCYQEAFSIFEDRLGPSHPLTQTCAQNLSSSA